MGAHTVPGIADPTCCSVIELRQYTLHPGKRATLVDLFEHELLQPQIDTGMHIVGTFCDRADDDRFVWIRGFSSDEARTDALSAFYGRVRGCRRFTTATRLPPRVSTRSRCTR